MLFLPPVLTPNLPAPSGWVMGWSQHSWSQRALDTNVTKKKTFLFQGIKICRVVYCKKLSVNRLIQHLSIIYPQRNTWSSLPEACSSGVPCFGKHQLQLPSSQTKNLGVVRGYTRYLTLGTNEKQTKVIKLSVEIIVSEYETEKRIIIVS